jgi:hypothetical protein
MKRIYFLVGLVFPGFAVKAVAQDIRFRPIDLSKPEGRITTIGLPIEAKQKLALYEISPDESRRQFLIDIIQAGHETDSVLNVIQIEEKANEILDLSIEDQRDVIKDLIAKGGIEWGKITDPSDHI